MWVIFCGHGQSIDGTTYLLPWDTDTHVRQALQQTAISADTITTQLAQIKTKALIVAYEVCRVDPNIGPLDVSRNYSLNRQEHLELLPDIDLEAIQPQMLLTLFSASPGEVT